MNRNSVAKKVRLEKEEHPERFCPNKQCLWRVMTRDGHKPCPNHMRSTGLSDISISELTQELCEAVFESGKAFGRDGVTNHQQSPSIHEIRTEFNKRVSGLVAPMMPRIEIYHFEMPYAQAYIEHESGLAKVGGQPGQVLVRLAANHGTFAAGKDLRTALRDLMSTCKSFGLPNKIEQYEVIFVDTVCCNPVEVGACNA